jgi:hypothetical protein
MDFLLNSGEQSRFLHRGSDWLDQGGKRGSILAVGCPPAQLCPSGNLRGTYKWQYFDWCVPIERA